MLTFLADYRDRLVGEAVDAFWGGGLTALQETEGRGRARFADELVELKIDDIARFYGVPWPPEEKEGT